MRRQWTWLGTNGLVGGGVLAVLVSVGCGDLGGNPNDNRLNAGGRGNPGGASGAGGAGGANNVCPPNVPMGSAKRILLGNCTGCHGSPLLAGAPMPMLSYQDLFAPAKSNPSKKVIELIVGRMKDTVKSMPPEGNLPAAEIAIMESWIQAGAPPCGLTGPPPPGVGGSGVGGSGVGGSGGGGSGFGGSGEGGSGFGGTGFGGSGEGGSGVGGSGEGGSGVGGSGTGGSGTGGAGGGPTEECYELRAHGGQTPGDSTPFSVGAGPWITSPGQFYENFIFKTPYNKKVTAIRTDPLIDNGAVLHHWLFFQVTRNQANYRDGSHSTVLGTHPDSMLISGWAPGGDPPDMPPGVGMEMPDPGGFFELEIHYNNPGGALKQDRSGVKICVTSEPVQNVATVTWLGTEQINVPARATANATGTCRPRNPQGGDIHILYSIPHMHKIGTHMKTVINRPAGPEILVDKPFKFDEQRSYDTPAIVKRGESLTTTCTFNNTTAAPVAFGTVSEAEMCYNFVVAYPARALNNAGNSIEGSLNTCLQ